MAGSSDLMALIHSGEISAADLELAAKLHMEHVKKHGSQTQEEKVIADRHKEAEGKRRSDRRTANAKKAETNAVAEAKTLVVDPTAISKFSVAHCKAQLKVWVVWLAAKGMKIGSRPGQVDFLQGNRDPMRDKLCGRSETYGAEAVAEERALGDDTIVATKTPGYMYQKFKLLL